MSLTGLIKNNPDIKKNIPNLKKYCRGEDSRLLKSDDWKVPILVEPVGQSWEWGLIGTTFDYMARAQISRKLGLEYKTEPNGLVAHEGLRYLYMYSPDGFSYRSKNEEVEKERDIGKQRFVKARKWIIAYIEKRLVEAESAYYKFINEEGDIENAIRAALFLARLDECYRIGSIHIVDEYFKAKGKDTCFSQSQTITDDQAIDNVLRMCILFHEFLNNTTWSKCIMNPSFGKFSCAVGGADADLIADNTIVEIKTHRKLSYVGNDVAQLLGYAAMARRCNYEINKAGIYYARFGKYIWIDLDEVIEPGFLDEYLDNILKISTYKQIFIE